MFAKSRKKSCRCPNCSGKCAEFQKVMDIKEFGLTLYRYVRRACDDGDTKDASSAVEPYDVFILHNTNAKEIAATDYVPAFEWKSIKCLRCRELAKKAQTLFQHVQSIGAKDLRGICDHCFSRQGYGSCSECQKIIRKFIASKRIDAVLSKNIKSTAQTMSETRFSGPSLTMMKKFTQSQSLPESRDVKVKQMFPTNTEFTDSDNILIDSHSSVSDGREISKHLSTDMDEVVKDVKFGPVSVFKKTLLETIAELDDISISKLIRDLVNALKQKQDEDGVHIPNAKFVAEKSDDELEQLVLQTIKSANRDIEIQILELIDAQDTANLHFSQIRKRLENKNFKAEDIDTNETKLISDSKMHVPQTKIVKARGSVEKIIHQEVKLEETRIKNRAQNVATLIRKQQLNKYLNKLYKVIPTDHVKDDDERTQNLITLVKKKLQKGKAEATETKKDSPYVSHKLFRKETQSVPDRDVVVDKEIEFKRTPVSKDLKPILKGAKIKKKAVMGTPEPYRRLHAKSKFQYDFFQESEIKLKPRIATSTELINVMKTRKEAIQKRDTEIKKRYKKKSAEVKEEVGLKKTIETALKKIGKFNRKWQHPQKKLDYKYKPEIEQETEIIATDGASHHTMEERKEIAEQTAKQKAEQEVEQEEKHEKEHEQKQEKQRTKEGLLLPANIHRHGWQEKKISQPTKSKIPKHVSKLKDKKDLDLGDITKQLEKVLVKQDITMKKNLKKKDKLQQTEKKHRSRANKALQTHIYDHLPSIPITERKMPDFGVIIKDEKGEEYIELPFKKIRLRCASDDDLILRLVRIRLTKYPRRFDEVKKRLIQEILAKRRARSKKRNENIDSYSDLELDLESFLAESSDDNGSMIVGNKILNPTETVKYLTSKEKETELLPSVFKTEFEVPESLPLLPQQLTEPQHESRTPRTHKTKREVSSQVRSQFLESAAFIRYQLSNKSFIDNGWTQLPTQKVFRKINVYRMYPARPQFNWFEVNSSKGYLHYNTGELLASIDDVGHGRWYYKNGNIALDFYDSEDLNAKQRIVIYSSGEPDNGRPKPVTILGSFDYCGNGVILDHGGKIRMKYNQTEGLLLDKKIGPRTHWKWHALNEPPNFQQQWVELKEKHLDPYLHRLSIFEENKIRPDNTDMERAAIELENSVHERRRAKGQEFRPFSIRMKTIKINDQFSVRVLDQANIHIMFREGGKTLKLNVGLELDPTEIVDTETLEVKPAGHLFDCILERCPAPTDSVDHLQYKIEEAKKFNNACVHHDQWVRPKLPVMSTDRLTSTLSRPMRIPLRTLPQQCNSCPCNFNSTL